jgi:hypothetical protein
MFVFVSQDLLKVIHKPQNDVSGVTGLNVEVLHNILQARASRPFSTVQKNIQQHPRSAVTLDSHNL